MSHVSLATERSLPHDEALLAKELELFREAAFSGRREDQDWKEWWCFWKAYTGLAGSHWPSAMHVRILHDRGLPDFLVRTVDGEHFLEVTEATTPEDRRAIAMSRHSNEVRFPGDPVAVRTHRGWVEHPGGRGGGRNGPPFLGDEPERETAKDVEDAITKKARKNYPDTTSLLVYLNSNVAIAGMSMRKVLDLVRDVNRSQFAEVVILSGSGEPHLV